MIKFHRRVIDPSTLYFDFIYDEYPPSLDKCLERAGIESKVTHEALSDAWDVVMVLRNKYHLL